MKLKYNFDMLNLGDDIIAVPVGYGAQEYHGVIKMNKSANMIFQLLKDEQTEETILNSLESNFDTSPIELKKYINTFIKELQERKLLTS